MQEFLKFLMFNARKSLRIADLETIEVQDGQHSSIGNWVEKFIGLPCGRQGAGFRFTVTNDAGSDQIRIIEHSPEGMAERVP